MSKFSPRFWGKKNRCLRRKRDADEPEQGGYSKAECQVGYQAKEAGIWEWRSQASNGALPAGGQMYLDGEREAC